MIHLPNDFREFLKLFNDHQVEYLLIGGYAVGHYGYPRATADMDIWVAIGPDNACKIVRAPKDFGFTSLDPSEGLFLKPDQVIRMGMPPLRIEIWTSVSGVQFDECYQSRAVTNWDKVRFNLIDLKHLKLNKKAAGRHKDLDDLQNLP